MSISSSVTATDPGPGTYILAELFNATATDEFGQSVFENDSLTDSTCYEFTSTGSATNGAIYSGTILDGVGFVDVAEGQCSGGGGGPGPGPGPDPDPPEAPTVTSATETSDENYVVAGTHPLDGTIISVVIDANNNGLIDIEEPPATGPVNVSGGQWATAPIAISETTTFLVVANDPVSGLPSDVVPHTVTFNGVNSAPEITSGPISISIDEDSGPNLFNFTASDADGDTLAWSISGFSGGAEVSTSASGTSAQITLTPAANTFGEGMLVVTVSDGDLADSQEVFFIINSVNDAPVFTSSNFAISVDEDPSTAASLQVTVSDADGDALEYSVSSATSGTSGLTGNGDIATLSYLPNADFNGTDEFVLTVSDGIDSIEQTISVTVNPVNDAPVISGSPATSVNVGELYSFTPTASDVDSASLTFSETGLPSWAAFSTTTGTLSGTPSADDVDSYDGIVITVTDDENLSDSLASFSIVVVANNTPPTASDVSAETDEDTPVAITLLGSDEDDNDTLTYRVGRAPGVGTVSVSGNVATYTPDTNANGRDTFSYIVSDGIDTAVAEVTVTIHPVNDDPEFLSTDFAITVQEDSEQAGILNVSVTDVDEDFLSYSVSSATSGTSSLIVEDNTAIVSYLPIENFNGSDEFTLSVNDGVSTITQAISVTVIPVNDPPAFTSDNFSITVEQNATTAATVTVTLEDVEGDTLSYSVTDASNGTSSVAGEGNTATVAYLPNTDFLGMDTFVLSVGDGTDIVTQTISVTVTEKSNTPPEAESFDITTDEDTPVSFSLRGTDVDEDELFYEIRSIPEEGELTTNGNLVIYTPPANFNTEVNIPDSFIYVAIDADGAESNEATVTLIVSPVNDAPIILGTPSTVAQADSEYQFLFDYRDVDNEYDTLELTTENVPAWLETRDNGKTLIGTPSVNDVGLYDNITINVSDGELTETLVFSIQVIDPDGNGAPIASDGSATTNEDTTVEIELIASDYNDDELSFNLATQPANGQVNIAGNVATYTPTSDFNGPDSFTFTATDGLLTSNEATIELTVAPVNDAPVISGTPATLAASGASYSFTPTVSDVDSDTFTFTIDSAPGWASFNATTGTLSGTPSENDIGTFEGIVITVSDGDLVDALPPFSIEVIDPNANVAPVVGDNTLTIDEDTTFTDTITAFDENGDALTFRLNLNATRGTVELLSNGEDRFTFTYTPPENEGGFTDFFTYVANDGLADSNEGTVTIIINDVNDAPEITGTPETSAKVNQAYSFVPTASDVENDTLTFTIANRPRWTSFDGNTGALTGTPGSSDVGIYGNVTISVSDGEDEVSLPPFNLEVTPNNAPTINGSALTEAEVGQTYAFTPTASDADGDTLTFSISSQPGWATFDASTGTLSGTPAPADVGIFQGILISVTDGTDTAALPSFTIEVCEVCGNVAPTINGVPAITVTEGQMYSFVPTASDANEDMLTFEIINQPSWASFDENTGALTGTPGMADVGISSGIIIRVTDGTLTDQLPPFSITVVEFNDAPTITGVPDTTVFQNDQYRFTPTATDADGDVLSFSISNQPGWASFNSRTGTLRGTPRDTDVGVYDSIVVTVSDGQNSASLPAFSIQVVSRNTPPVISGSPRTGISQGEGYSFTPNASDADGDTLTFSASGLPGWLSIDTEFGTLSGTPGADDVGTTDSIILTVNDGQASASLDGFTIEVTSDNTAPVANDQSVTVSEDGVVIIGNVASDSDGDNITLAIQTDVQHGQLVDIVTGWIYSPDADFNGSDSFTFTASDGEATSAPATISITVSSVNDSPIAERDVITVEQNETGIYLLDVLANDTDVDITTNNDVLTIQGADSSFGNVSIENNQLLYNPGISFIGTVNLTYAIRDIAGRADQATVRLTVNGVQGIGAPILDVPDDITVDATGLFTVVDLGVASATDGDGNPLPATITRGSTYFAPGSHTVHWQAEDSYGTTTTDSQTVNVNPLVSLSKDQIVREGASVRVSVLLNGDSPSYPLTISYTVDGTAQSDDHTATSGSVTFEEGTEQVITFDILNDDIVEFDETIVFSLNAEQNLGANNVSTITIREANIAPEIDLTVTQNGEERLTVAQDQSNVTITGVVTDANPGDVITVEWTSIGLANLSSSEESFVFNPASLATGVYQVTLFASDNGDPILSNTADVFIEVTETLAPLSATRDTDGDLIPDNQEGYTDRDGDGIPDFQDAINECNVVPEQASNQDNFLVESEPGVCMRRGSIAALNPSDGIEVLPVAGIGGSFQSYNSAGELVEMMVEGLPVDTEYAIVGGIYDFILYGESLQGASFDVIIPQKQPLPPNAVYRKYKRQTERWVNFAYDDNNAVYSAMGRKGFCPASGSPVWTEGLVEGAWCIKLLIEDGGPNDDDGVTNGAVFDPGGVGVFLNGNSLPEASFDSLIMATNTTATKNVLANDFDADGDELTVTSVVSDVGQVSIEGDGVISYTPPDGFAGLDTLVYIISDGRGGTASAEVAVTIRGNRAPGAVDDSAQTNDETSIEIDVLANDIDVDGDEITLVNASAENGDVMITDNQTIYYTPVLSFNGLDTITYQVADPSGAIGIATVSVVVEGNQAPMAMADEVTTEYNQPIEIDVLANDMDVNGDTLTIVSASADRGNVTINTDNTLTYTPPQNFSGSDTINYTVSDGQLESSTTVNVTVLPEPAETITVTNKSSGTMQWLTVLALLIAFWRRSARYSIVITMGAGR
ncbi:Ig-like domain-containing protein [Aestuariibacter salexigens]|uniref:Ig-like domain-containing protein n=1 Tax=Aestuariibacter salexigens TaxID=226010 RepID=UPI00146FB48E|nr:Ig-like domain-containing protein [Aestuariibacter salexigens]